MVNGSKKRARGGWCVWNASENLVDSARVDRSEVLGEDTMG